MLDVEEMEDAWCDRESWADPRGVVGVSKGKRGGTEDEEVRDGNNAGALAWLESIGLLLGMTILKGTTPLSYVSSCTLLVSGVTSI